MKIIYAYSKPGSKKANEDIYGYIKNFAFVIDGATDVFNEKNIRKNNEVAWYVNQLKRKLISKYSENLKLSEILNVSIKELYDKILSKVDISKIKEYKLPTFSIAMIRTLDKGFEYYILGDSCISYMKKNKCKIISDTRINKFVKYNRRQIKLNKYSSEKTYQKTRKQANARNGYPIGSIRGTSIKLGKTGEIKSNSSILMFTDGILDYVTIKKNNINELFNIKTINKEINNINYFYNNNIIYKKSGRPKLNDDKTILLIKETL